MKPSKLITGSIASLLLTFLCPQNSTGQEIAIVGQKTPTANQKAPAKKEELKQAPEKQTIQITSKPFQEEKQKKDLITKGIADAIKTVTKGATPTQTRWIPTIKDTPLHTETNLISFGGLENSGKLEIIYQVPETISQVKVTIETKEQPTKLDWTGWEDNKTNIKIQETQNGKQLRFYDISSSKPNEWEKIEWHGSLLTQGDTLLVITLTGNLQYSREIKAIEVLFE